MIHKQLPRDPPSPADDLPWDTVSCLLTQPIRRALLVALDESESPLAVADISKEIVRRTSDKSGEEISHQDTEKCYISLHHRDIPKLAGYGVVAVDEERNTVALTDKGAELVRVLDSFVDQRGG